MPLENHTPCTNTWAQPFNLFSICLKGYHSYVISCQGPQLNQEKLHPLVPPHSLNHLITKFHKGEIFALAESLQIASSHFLVFDISGDFLQENLSSSWELFMTFLGIKVRAGYGSPILFLPFRRIGTFAFSTHWEPFTVNMKFQKSDRSVVLKFQNLLLLIGIDIFPFLLCIKSYIQNDDFKKNI